MSLRLIEPWGQLTSKFTSKHIYGVNLALLYDLPVSILSGDSSGYERDVSLELLADGWLRYTHNAAVSGTRYGGMVSSVLRRGITLAADSVLYGGFRVRCPLSSMPAYLFNPCFTGSAVGVTQLNGITPAHIPGGMKVNTEYYIEWCLDLPNKLMKYRVDGVEIAFTVALTVAQVAQAVAGEYWMCHAGWSPNAGYVVDFKDGYVTDKSADGIQSGWLGPQIVRKVALTEITSPWTASSGTVKDVLSTPPTDSASRLTPLVTSDLDATEAVMKFDFSAIQGKVSGVAVSVLGRRPQGKLGQAELSATLNGSTIPARKAALTLDMTSFADSFTVGAAPDGQPWTKASLSSTNFKLKPAT